MKGRSHRLLAATALVHAALLLGLASPARAEEAPPPASDAGRADEGAPTNDIIVTAQRVEERLQDVPISITVFNEQKLQDANIVSAKDLATYTPGLSTNNRFGADNTTWTIRGFTQEMRTTATVGTYFADVVAPRGSGATQGGDGAGPGYLFDLQNVQVLKGPQGTLFGRNSTGGAVLLVPHKPTDQFGGYLEGSVGNYDLRRVQAVVNVPVGDSFRIRASLDRNERDGYLKNAGLIGFGPHGSRGGSIDYWAARLSAIADLAPNLEHYLIVNYSRSKSTGIIPKLTRCFTTSPYPNVTLTAAAVTQGQACLAQMAREAPLGFWSVSNPLPDSLSDTEQWQVINTTTWNASDNLTIKNIFSYAEFRGDTNLDLFGYYQPTVTPGTETNGNQVRPFNTTHRIPESHTNAESSLVEELQLQGHSGDNRFVWQGGLYYEVSNPLGKSGIQSTTLTPCADIGTFNCVPLGGGPATAASAGRLSYSTTLTSFRGEAAYFQASYNITDQLKATAGVRYTDDRVNSLFQVVGVTLRATAPGNTVVCTNATTFGAPGSATNPNLPLDRRFSACLQRHVVSTHAPTWLLGLDYKPWEDVLLYGKWSRGYRQGGVSSFGADLLQDFKKETVDTYEVGGKATWRGAFPGYFNLSAFYNNFRDQQIQFGLQCIPTTLCAQTNAVVNAGKSSLKGFEAEAGISPFTGLRLEASYAYLKTRLKEIADITNLVRSLGLPFNDFRPVPVGAPIPNAIPHKVTATATYTLPLDDSIGKVSFGGTFVYTSAYRAVTDPFLVSVDRVTPVQPLTYASNFGVLPHSYLLNLNFNWQDVARLPVDLAVFVTNVTNEHVFLHANVQTTNGFISNLIGEPRMYGMRLRYKFGG